MRIEVELPEGYEPRASGDTRPRVFDCFTFFNELDLLEIRLHELDEVVDYFVIAEAAQTFRGSPKELFFRGNKGRFTDFNHKIILVTVYDFEGARQLGSKFSGQGVQWVRQRNQRAALIQGLELALPLDWILLSDLDEIPRSTIVKSIASNSVHRRAVHMFEHTYYTDYLNWEIPRPDSWVGTKMLERRFLRSMQGVRDLRHAAHKDAPIPWFSWRLRLMTDLRALVFAQLIADAGWHFSSIGSPDQIMRKLASLSGGMLRIDGSADETYSRIVSNLQRGKTHRGQDYKRTPISQLPRYVQDNVEKFQHMLDLGDRSTRAESSSAETPAAG